MSAADYFFYGWCLVMVAGLWAMAVSKKLIHAALGLLSCLVALAGIYALLSAELLAVIQLMVYAGGVLVLILFGIMLTGRLSDKPMRIESRNVAVGSVIAAGLFITLIVFVGPAFLSVTSTGSPGSLRTLSLALFSEYTLAFELAGVLLLISLIAGAVIASSRQS
ncbi:MAG: NADH-quinone oxidoreductase subunit J [Cyclobacteriaceae bacterium]|jgi:NADH-quinone oxidoreductase subunit J|nr:NADH-quinone oxidoreductase subunit J [Cyclobacteriaceae bacterium]